MDLEDIIKKRFSEKDYYSNERNDIIIKSIPELKANGFNQNQLNDKIDELLEREDLYLNSENYICKHTHFSFLNIYKLQNQLKKINKEDQFEKFNSIIIWSEEVNHLYHDILFPEIDRIYTANLELIKANMPSIVEYGTLPFPNFIISLSLKSLLFIHRSCIDKMLSIFNSFNSLLNETKGFGSKQPSENFNAFITQYLDGKYNNWDKRILEFIDRYYVSIIILRNIRNRIKIGDKTYFSYFYINGTSFIEVTLKSVKNVDPLIQKLIERSLLEDSSLKIDLKATCELADKMIQDFLSIFYEILKEKTQ